MVDGKCISVFNVCLLGLNPNASLSYLCLSYVTFAESHPLPTKNDYCCWMAYYEHMFAFPLKYHSTPILIMFLRTPQQINKITEQNLPLHYQSFTFKLQSY